MVKYYTQEEISSHNHFDDCWVTIHDTVYDLTPLLKKHGKVPLALPILEQAGGSVSHWFVVPKDPKDPVILKKFIDPEGEIEMPYVPQGRFFHVPSSLPIENDDDVRVPWWQDEQYMIGKVSKKTMKIRITNMLTQNEDTLKVCKEESLKDIKDRYLEYNRNAHHYAWKIMRDGKLVLLNDHLNLEDNDIKDESDTYLALGLDEDEYLPNILIYYSDDLHDA